MIKRFLNKIGSYIEFSSFERRGIFALLFVLILFLGYYFVRSNFTYSKTPVDETALAAYQSQLDEKFGQKPVGESHSWSEDKPKEKSPLGPFNPNLDSFEDLVAKGVPAKIARNLVNYRKSGGVFKSKNDLTKLYSINEQQYRELEPYIVISISSQNETEERKQQTEELQEKELKSNTQIKWKDINKAVLQDLKQVRGIGDVIGERILKYRNSLGGFYSLNQLKEVYGLTDEVYVEMQEYFTVNSNNLQKIDINGGDFKSILKHPYLDYQETKAIVNYLDQHGSINSLSEFKSLHIFKGKNIDRILPYLDLK